MLCVADVLDALNWVESIGGLKGTIQRSNQNLSVVKQWVAVNDWIDFLPISDDITSKTSICLKFNDVSVTPDWIKKMCVDFESQDIAYDIGAYRAAPAGLRIWGGATVDHTDIGILLNWIEYKYNNR